MSLRSAGRGSSGLIEILRSRGWALLRVAILYQVALLLVITPVTAFLWRSAVTAATGSAAVVNEALPRLITSPVSLLLIAIAALITLSVERIVAGASGLTVLSGSQNTARALFDAGKSLGGLLSVALWQYWRLFLYSMPAVAAAAGAYLVVIGPRGPVSAFARNPQAITWIGGLLGVALALLWAYLLLGWIFATALYIADGFRGRAALARSRELMRGRLVKTATGLALLVLGFVTVGVAVSLLARWLVLSSSGDSVWLALSLALNSFVGLALTLAAIVATNAFVLSRYLDARGKPVPQPGSEPVGRLTWVIVGLLPTLALVIGGLGLVIGVELLKRPVDVSRIELIAHRAGEAYAPENSLSAVTRALQDGADRLEFDVQRTKDDRLVVAHDADLLRLSGEDVVIGSSTLKEVQAVDIGDGERVPTLEEFLDAAGDTPLALEIKTHEGDQITTRDVVALLQKRRAVQRTVVMSLDPELTSLAHEQEPDLQTADLVSLSLGTAYRLPSDVIAPSSATAPAPFVLGAHLAGKRVWVWAVEEDELIREAALRGVDGIITNDVPNARRVLGEMSSIAPSEVARLRIGDLLDALAN